MVKNKVFVLFIVAGCSFTNVEVIESSDLVGSNYKKNIYSELNENLDLNKKFALGSLITRAILYFSDQSCFS